MYDPGQVLSYLRTLQTRHTEYFSATSPRLLAFVGTTSRPGTRCDIFARPIVGLESAGNGVTDVVVRGQLPREVGPDECVTVLTANLREFTGFQLKTARIEPEMREQVLHETEGRQTRIHGRFVYTVHPSPNVTKHFESAPVAEIQRAIEGTRYALIGIGQEVNISPRFAWQVENCGSDVCLYWGDGHLNKTAANFAKNPSLSALVLDLQTFDGMLLRGEGQSFTSKDQPGAHEKVIRGFASGGWGDPALLVRASFSQWGRI
jgi:hypothetical protein